MKLQYGYGRFTIQVRKEYDCKILLCRNMFHLIASTFFLLLFSTSSVNVRLLKEQAQRERRNFTKAEELAAKFPSRKRCPACWFDREMNEFDSFEVYTFLKGHYWPSSNLPWQSNGRGKQIHGEMSIEGEPLSTFGFYCTLAPFVIMICIFVKHFGLNRFWLSLFPSQTSKNKSF